jgi:enoyl-CoA hydratase/carnithine racemase
MRQPEPLTTVPAAPAAPAASVPATPVASPAAGWPVSADLERPLGDHAGAPRVHVAGGIAQLRLARPAEHNRLDPADLDAMTAWFSALATDGSVRVLVITGTGERSFSSGYTLDAIVSDLDDRLERMLDTLETLPFLTLAAMNGSVYGGATDLALACDIRLGPQGCRMFMPAAKFGLHYYPGGLRRYVTRLGLAAAQKLFLTAMTIDSDEMLRIGFLTEAVPASGLAARVQAYLEAALLTEPVAVREMKRHLGQVAAGRYDELTLRAATQRSLASPALRERLGERAGGGNTKGAGR